MTKIKPNSHKNWKEKKSTSAETFEVKNKPKMKKNKKVPVSSNQRELGAPLKQLPLVQKHSSQLHSPFLTFTYKIQRIPINQFLQKMNKNPNLIVQGIEKKKKRERLRLQSNFCKIKLVISKFSLLPFVLQKSDEEESEKGRRREKVDIKESGVC